MKTMKVQALAASLASARSLSKIAIRAVLLAAGAAAGLLLLFCCGVAAAVFAACCWASGGVLLVRCWLLVCCCSAAVLLVYFSAAFLLEACLLDASGNVLVDFGRGVFIRSFLATVLCQLRLASYLPTRTCILVSTGFRFSFSQEGFLGVESQTGQQQSPESQDISAFIGADNSPLSIRHRFLQVPAVQLAFSPTSCPFWGVGFVRGPIRSSSQGRHFPVFSLSTR